MLPAIPGVYRTNLGVNVHKWGFIRKRENRVPRKRVTEREECMQRATGSVYLVFERGGTKGRDFFFPS